MRSEPQDSIGRKIGDGVVTVLGTALFVGVMAVIFAVVIQHHFPQLGK